MYNRYMPVKGFALDQDGSRNAPPLTKMGAPGLKEHEKRLTVRPFVKRKDCKGIADAMFEDWG